MAAHCGGSPRPYDPTWLRPVATAEHNAGETDETSCPCVSIDIHPDCDPRGEWLLQPRGRREGNLRCLVRRGPKESWELEVEDGHVFLLSARRGGAKEWVISSTNTERASAPIARLTQTDNNRFACCRVHRGHAYAEACHVRHTTLRLSAHLPELNAMEVAFPRLSSADRSGVGAEQTVPSEWAPGELRESMRRVFEARRDAPSTISADTCVLVTRKPKWNARCDSFELPFHGRAACSSERNFQLVALENAGVPPHCRVAGVSLRHILRSPGRFAQRGGAPAAWPDRGRRLRTRLRPPALAARRLLDRPLHHWVVTRSTRRDGGPSFGGR